MYPDSFLAALNQLIENEPDLLEEAKLPESREQLFELLATGTLNPFTVPQPPPYGPSPTDTGLFADLPDPAPPEASRSQTKSPQKSSATVSAAPSDASSNRKRKNRRRRKKH